MTAELNQIDILIRREIEARITVPLIKAFIKEISKGAALKVVKKVIISLAHESGVKLAEQMGGASMADFAKGLSAWGAGGAYELDVLELSDVRYYFDIKRCRYAEMYQELDCADFGFILSCSRDFALVEGFKVDKKAADFPRFRFAASLHDRIEQLDVEIFM